MPPFFSRTTRRVANRVTTVSSQVLTTAKRKGAALTARYALSLTSHLLLVYSLQATCSPAHILTYLQPRPVEIFNESNAHYDIVGLTNMFFTAIGTPNLRIKSHTPEPSTLKKKRRRRLRDGTFVLEEYRDQNAGSESEDSDSYCSSDGADEDSPIDIGNRWACKQNPLNIQDTDCVVDIGDSVIEDIDSSNEDTISDCSSYHTAEEYDDEDWVKLRFRWEKELSGSDIHRIVFQPTPTNVRTRTYRSSFAHRRRSSESERTVQDGEKERTTMATGKRKTYASTAWKKTQTKETEETRLAASVMYVPEASEELDKSKYHSPHSFIVEQHS